MNIRKIKKGQKVWIIGESEYPEQLAVFQIDENEVWLENGNPYKPGEIWSSKNLCGKAN